MARPPSVDDDELLARLAGVFRDVGYEGASLALLADAAGLQKASLYHRFPGGKQQMAKEVLAAALAWVVQHVITPLQDRGDPADRLAAVSKRLSEFYVGGRKACLLNMLAAPRQVDGPFGLAIKGAFEALIAAFAKLARDAGSTPAAARRRAERALALLQGSLVLARGLGDPEPFRRALADLPDLLLESSR